MTQTSNIPILDLGPQIDELWDELCAAVQRVMRSGRFILGPEGAAFESEAAAYLGVKHAVGLNSGTDALVIALRALGIGAGDEVITTPFTFIATAEAVSQVGATPVFVDIDPASFNIDVSLIEAAVTPRTRAILPVHLFGRAADMPAILEIAQRHDLKVLEDVAQAFGGRIGGGGHYRGQVLGSLGHAGAFSFFPSKNLGAFGDAGLIATNDGQVAELARTLRGHGQRRRYEHELHGYNSRLDELQAAILRVKLPHTDACNRRRRDVAKRYRELLGGVGGLTLPTDSEDGQHVYHQYTVRIADGRRDAVHQSMAASGINTMIYYPIPLHRQPVYRELDWPAFPHAEQAAAEVLSLPMGPDVSAEAQQRVAEALRACLNAAV